MLQELFTVENLIALVTLTSLEIVLGIDNVVFISILTGKLPEEQQPRARYVGLALAMLLRIALLFALSWVIHLDKNALFTILDHGVTGKDLIMLVGGLFLIAKATFEIHEKIEGPDAEELKKKTARHSFTHVIIQVLALDLVFSLDSVITAVGMAQALWVMVTAVIIAVAVMMIFAGQIARFVERYPTIKMLALSFLLLIGVLLVAEGFHIHVPKGYIYFAMAFSLMVELLNLKVIGHQLRRARRRVRDLP